MAKVTLLNHLGDGKPAGYINYATGKGRIIPNNLPQKNTQFNITYNYGSQLSQSKSAIPDGNQQLTFTIGTGSSIQPSSVALDIPVTDQSGLNTLIVHLKDDPTGGNMGNLINDAGDIQGTIDYSTGQCIVTPTASYKTFSYVYEARYTATYASA